nr:NADH dehydrogenase subunit 1 [Neoseiulus californicus]WKV28871.2 NADH dehydrogenase subunit 1 [Neoseiulus californicus]
MYFMFLFLILIVLLGIAFFTLFERKLLGYIQLRKGPNKVILKGIFQPIVDGVKLFLKNESYLFLSKKIFFFPFFMLLMMMMYWLIFKFFYISIFNYSIIYFMAVSSISVYGVLGSGWCSNSKYGLLGAYRSVAQMVSYEVGMVFMLMFISIFVLSYSYEVFTSNSNLSHFLLFGGSLMNLIWFIIILAELNRAPFDFSESESELVSGFNVEFGGVKFAFMFLGEYGNMLFMSYFTANLFMGSIMFFMLMYMFMMIWVRGVFPRYRYDNLMYLNWKVFLPCVMVVLFLVLMLKYILM